MCKFILLADPVQLSCPPPLFLYLFCHLHLFPILSSLVGGVCARARASVCVRACVCVDYTRREKNFYVYSAPLDNDGPLR